MSYVCTFINVQRVYSHCHFLPSGDLSIAGGEHFYDSLGSVGLGFSSKKALNKAFANFKASLSLSVL